MSEERNGRIDEWLSMHNVSNVGDLVFDGNGMIMRIGRGVHEPFEIVIIPLLSTHDLGSGICSQVVIQF